MPPIKPLRQPKLSDIILRHLEQMIVEGSMKPGQRLPPERELAVQFEVSRPSVREALQKLEAKGLIVRRQGGGNFVTDNLGASYTEPLFELLSKHPDAQQDLLEFRHALEGVAAFHAAQRATSADCEIIARRFNDWMSCHQACDPIKEARADTEFHLSIAEAAHNLALLHTMRTMFAMMQHSMLERMQALYVDEAWRQKVLEQHVRLRDAVLGRDPIRARNAAQAHLAYVGEMTELKSRVESRHDRARRRLRQLDAVLPRSEPMPVKGFDD
ncbi:MAG: GntR family transcriptional regulator [Hahellaceae bacterium]|jgi:GntR family transcriptional repressor for pyruvate dehydrogenase complex|nr:GntR family transcriptional regulator [Hahellaceae bacterium]